MKKLLLIGLLALGGCGQFQSTWDKLTGATLSPNAVYVAANSADSAEIIATGYLRACHHSPTTYAACSKSIESQVANSVRAVRKARNDLRAFLVSHPDALGASGLYDALKQAQMTLSDLINAYNLTQVK